jgi:hypothetical protein
LISDKATARTHGRQEQNPMEQAKSMWAMLDSMAESDPAEYSRFMKEQMQQATAGAAQPVTEIPSPAFCVRMRLEGGAALFVNVCTHSRIKPPSSNSDGSVPIACGLPRELPPQPQQSKGGKKAAPATGKVFPVGSVVVDVVVSAEVTRRAGMDAAFREEVGALASQCARDVLTGKRLLSRLLLPGYRVLAASDTKYAGEPQPFADVNGGNRRVPDDAASAALGLPAGLMEQLASMGGLGGAAKASGDANAAGGARGSGGSAHGGVAETNDGSATPLERGELRLPGAPPQPPPSDVAPAANAACGVGRGSASSGGSAQVAAAARRPLVEELSSEAAVEEQPEHELLTEPTQLKLLANLPRLAAIADLDVEVGDRALSLRAEGIYCLRIEPLPQPVRSDDARCKFDKKRRLLTITMPVAAELQ